MESTTRSMTWRSELSRSIEPSCPLKYFWATMLVAFCDQLTGNSTPVCSNATVPSRKLLMRASRRSHRTSSYGSTSGVVKWRRIPMPVCSGAIAIGKAPSRFLLHVLKGSDHNILWVAVSGAPRCGVHFITVITPVSSDAPRESAGHGAFAKICADDTAGPLWSDRSLTLWIRGLVPRPAQQTGFPLEVAHVGEPLVDAGEP